MKLIDHTLTLSLPPYKAFPAAPCLTDRLSRCYMRGHAFACVLIALYGAVIIASGCIAHQKLKHPAVAGEGRAK